MQHSPTAPKTIPKGLVGMLKIANYLDSHSNVIYTAFMIDQKLTSDLLRGHTDTIILGLLAAGDKYGYEITKLVHDKSAQAYELKEIPLCTYVTLSLTISWAQP